MPYIVLYLTLYHKVQTYTKSMLNYTTKTTSMAMTKSTTNTTMITSYTQTVERLVCYKCASSISLLSLRPS